MLNSLNRCSLVAIDCYLWCFRDRESNRVRDTDDWDIDCSLGMIRMMIDFIGQNIGQKLVRVILLAMSKWLDDLK
jgi:hypothetical protein